MGWHLRLPGACGSYNRPVPTTGREEASTQVCCGGSLHSCVSWQRLCIHFAFVVVVVVFPSVGEREETWPCGQ